MTQDEPNSEMARRLSEGLTRLAERATTSPDALDRILSASKGTADLPGPARAGRPRGPGADEEDLATVVTLTPRIPVAPRHTKRWGAKAVVPILGLAAALVVAALVIGPGTPHHNTPQRIQTGGSNETSMPSSVVGGPGSTRVAWIAGGTLYIGSSGTPSSGTGSSGTGRAIGAGQNPEWSADGKWLAYLVAESGQSYQIWVVRSNGTDDHQVLSAPGFAAFLWSPAADQLAAVPLTAAGTSAGLVVTGTTGPSRDVLAPSTAVDSMMWSQDGTQLAYSGPGGVFTVPVSGGAAVAVAYTPPSGATVILAGWWPGDEGLLLWADKPGAVESDGLPLVAVPLRGGSPQTLAITQVYLSWLAWSPGGSQLALVAGSGSTPNYGKSIKICSPPASVVAGSSSSAKVWSCRKLPQPAGAVSIDPAWSPDGTQLSFVRASASDSSSAFYSSRTLYIASSDGSQAQAVAVMGGSSGAVLPVWSANGSDIGYSTGSSIDLVPAGGGKPEILASGLSGSYQGSSVGTDSFGKEPWGGSAAWDTGPGSAADGDS